MHAGRRGEPAARPEYGLRVVQAVPSGVPGGLAAAPRGALLRPDHPRQRHRPRRAPRHAAVQSEELTE